MQEGDRLDRNPRLGENFLEPLLLALVVAEDRHFPALGQPVAQMIEKKIAPIFLEDEVAARRMEKIVGEKRQVVGRATVRRCLAGLLLPPRPDSPSTKSFGK